MLVTYRDGDELIVAECSVLVPVHLDGACDVCSAPLSGRQTRWCSRACALTFETNHLWSAARSARRRLDARRCVRCGSPESLEVNHLVPRAGRGYGWGCHHHLNLLETLCHDCHVLVTRQQQQQRALAAGPLARRRPRPSAR